MHHRGLKDTNENYYLIFIKPLFNNLAFTMPALRCACGRRGNASLVQKGMMH
jgi:hypothetical protein